MEKDVRTYEINFLLVPLIPEDKVNEEVAVLRKIIENQNGLITSEDQVKIQRLSYPINKFDSAYYGWFRFSVAPEAILAIKDSFIKEEKVIRTFVSLSGKEDLIKFNSKKTEPSISSSSPEREAVKKEIVPEQIEEKLKEILKEENI